jgi:hypothetical protein
MHPLMAAWRERWLQLNPTWDVLLWREDREAPDRALRVYGIRDARFELPGDHLDLLARAADLSQRSNVWRYHLVAHFGGTYVDADVEPLRPLDDFFGPIEGAPCGSLLFRDLSGGDRALEELPRPGLKLEAFACARWRERDVLESAVFGAAPGHPWAVDLARSLAGRDPAASMSMGPGHLAAVTARHPEVALLPREVFVFDHPSPWSTGEVRQAAPSEAETRARYPGATAVHHYAKYWFPRGFEPISKSPTR